MSDMSGVNEFDPANGAWFYYELWEQSNARIAELEAEVTRLTERLDAALFKGEGATAADLAARWEREKR